MLLKLYFLEKVYSTPLLDLIVSIFSRNTPNFFVDGLSQDQLKNCDGVFGLRCVGLFGPREIISFIWAFEDIKELVY